MTIPILDLVTQYTGTGTRTFFEYGFELYEDSTVYVLVDGVPVSFVEQETGIVISPAPSLGAVIFIFRETETTQKRDFQAFESFPAEKTEGAVDKLILLKQEALIWRAAMNLYSDPYVERLDIVNDKGDDATIYLWNEFFAGVFSGLVTTQMPNAGTVVEKPEDFAYFQYGPEYAGGFRDYEVIYLMTTEYLIRAIGVDYVAQTYTEYGTLFVGAERGIDIDETDTYLFNEGGTGSISQHVWRGTCFSTVYSEAHAGLNDPKDILTLSGLQEFVVVGEEAFSHGLRTYDYEIAAPFDFDSTFTSTPSNDFWNGLFDLRFGNNGLAQKGDALVCQPQNGNDITTYRNVGGVLTLVDQLTASSVGNKAAWSCDRDSGIMTSHSAIASLFRAYQIDMSDLTISYIGELSPTDQEVLAVAAVPDETDMFITCENTGAANDIVRTYRHDGIGGLTKLDELAMVGDTNANAHFRVSPYTKRLWLIGTGQANAYEVDGSGLITKLIDLPYAVGSTGAVANFIAFTQDPDGLVTTTNGFTGIKQKLYEMWEGEEASGTRVGAMGNADMYVNAGAPASRTGIVGNAPDFDGASNFYISAAGGAATVATPELQTQGSFSGCLNVLFDSVAAPHVLVQRGRLDYSSTSDRDFMLYQSGSTLRWLMQIGGTAYEAVSTVTVTTATDYHVYFGYDKAADQIFISVNDETLVTTALPANSTINLYAGANRRFAVGRRSSGSPQYYHDGYIDQFAWFWDTLSTTQRSFMYNSGSSRAFSEL